MKKPFDAWNKLKVKLDKFTSRKPYFKEREVWWCHIGLNIGDEENGKGDGFSRPVLIIRVFNKNVFWGIPLSSIRKAGRYYYPVTVDGIEGSALISQLRVFDSKRLQSRLGKVTDNVLKEIKRVTKLLLDDPF